MPSVAARVIHTSKPFTMLVTCKAIQAGLNQKCPLENRSLLHFFKEVPWKCVTRALLRRRFIAVLGLLLLKQLSPFDEHTSSRQNRKVPYSL